MGKATYKGKGYGRGYDKGTTYLYYEYRGHEYMVEDRHWNPAASDMTLALQHRRAQDEIDDIIERKSKPEEPCRYEDTAAYAFDKFCAYIEGDEHALEEL